MEVVRSGLWAPGMAISFLQKGRNVMAFCIALPKQYNFIPRSSRLLSFFLVITRTLIFEYRKFGQHLLFFYILVHLKVT